jgi:hypothetical protein
VSAGSQRRLCVPEFRGTTTIASLSPRSESTDGEILAKPGDTVGFMSIGVGIFLFVVGAVLTFALNVELGWINLDLVGYLMMGAGIVVVIIGLVLLMRRRQSITTERSGMNAAGERVTQRASETDPLA